MSEERDNFGLYAAYYDLVYADKDYSGEVEYLLSHIRKHKPDANTLLNLGCGTGRHDRILAHKGLKVTGVDLSASMLEQARGHAETEKLDLSYHQGDIRSVRLESRFDVVTSLFHVFSYQTGNEDLRAAFDTAHCHLEPGGLLLFDCWYGPAVLTDPPVVRVKRLARPHLKLTRLAEPEHLPHRNRVDVHYEIQLEELPSGNTTVLGETHRMRYLFSPEVALFAELAGFRILHSEEWMTGNQPGISSWNVVFALERV